MLAQMSDFSTSAMWRHLKNSHMERNIRFLQIYHAEKFEISPHVENIQISPHMSCIEIWNISTWQFLCADVSVRSLTISLNKNAVRTCKGHGWAPTCDILSSFLSVLLSHLFFWKKEDLQHQQLVCKHPPTFVCSAAALEYIAPSFTFRHLKSN